MTSKDIRKNFLEFFREKGHEIVPSAPMVLKSDPTLMFTNAGMNQFKDFFLGTQKAEHTKVADTQKCLRVTGKHNDLEEVGHDTYHHTMFEMLGNWSFGDYFKAEAIAWAWEFLTGRLGLNPEQFYITIFKGDAGDGLDRDQEAADLWKKFVPADRILEGDKKDNFWEMGDTGPCGPCSEIHVDLRSDADRRSVAGAGLVNSGHPQVVEIWNLVFIQFNRLSNGKLENLPEKHVDTGMGFERLCMAMQGKQSNYDTDLFQPVIQRLAGESGRPYGASRESDVAMRVVADHLRAISFSIADGQMPSNNKAGYVIRRILRRAVRYGYTYLGFTEAFMHRLVPVLVEVMGEQFPELRTQQDLIGKVIREEEQSFLSTLDTGIRLLDQLTEKARVEERTILSGKDAFVLYDTYGFPLDLTELILAEKNMRVDRTEFETEMQAQKSRSRQDAEREAGDWTVLIPGGNVEFVGYDSLTSDARIVRYRHVVAKKKEYVHLVLDRTPFYAESGGQIGDRGVLVHGDDTVEILDTIKENDLIVHVCSRLPRDPKAPFVARVRDSLRIRTANNHTATHLMHHALRDILGTHVEQKGSLVEPTGLRFDFSHFQKMSDEEIRQVEQEVNRMIRMNHGLEEHRTLAMDKARDMGAMALFGEKYGDRVRVIKFGDSVELCGGTHVEATGQIGLFKILRESSIAAGIRRIEATTGEDAEAWVYGQLDSLQEIAGEFEKQKDLAKAVRDLRADHARLSRAVEGFQQQMLAESAKRLVDGAEKLGAWSLSKGRVDIQDPSQLRDLAFRVKSQQAGLALILGAEVEGKAHLAVLLPEELHKEKGLNASDIIRDAAREIQGGGGGQPFFATAGGKNPAGLDAAMARAAALVAEKLT
ncbi:MAG: alanine--tRNA ligase [Bacteroidales bacterium]